MNNSEVASVWLRLKSAGLVDGEAPGFSSAESPWFVRVMLGGAAWVGAVFLLLFVTLCLGLRSPSALVGLGLVISAVAVGLLRRAPEHADFAVQLGIAMSFTGQAAVLIAVSDFAVTVAALIITCLEAVLFAAVPNFVHRVWSAAACAVACAIALGDWQLHVYATGLIAAGCAWIWLHEFQYGKHRKVLMAAGYGLVLALIGTAAWVITDTSASRQGQNPLLAWRGHEWLAAALNGAVLLWAVRGMLTREGIDESSPARLSIMVAAGMLALTTLKAPGLALAVLIMLLGFGNGNIVLVGLGIAALLGYLSFYYYALEITLLYKSVLMMTTGLGLLVSRVLLQRVLSVAPAPRDGHA